MKGITQILIFAIFLSILSTSFYAYNITDSGYYCHNCTDCMDAINNVTMNVTYLNMSIYVESSCVDNPENFTNEIFDCQNYNITGSGTAAIYLNNRNNVTVRNCDIAGYNGYGILLTSSTDNTILNNTIWTPSTISILLQTSSDNNVIASNTLRMPDWYYNLYGGYSSRNIKITDSSNNNITGNNISHAYRGQGPYIEISNATYTNIINNNVYGSYCSYLPPAQLCDGSGIYAADFTDSVIANNTISGNLTGIYISSASDNTIINNSISGHTSAATYSGINLYASEANNVTNNSIIDATSTSYGISLYAASNINNITANIISSAANIYLQLSDENIINDNTIYNGVRGFLTYMANYNNFTNNIVTGSTLTNIYLLASSYNNFTYNTMTNTKYGIQIEDDPGDWSISPIPEYFDNYIDTTNTIGGKTVYYYRNQYNTTLSPSSPGFLGCFNCTNVTIRDTSISENGQGILLASTNDSLITNCTIGSNYMGFYFDTATYNNNVTNSLIYGNDYLTVVDLGVNNIFGNDNIYLYDMIVPVSNTWYTSFDEMSFKISNLTYANMICSQYINNTLTKTNTSVKDNQKTNFTYTASEGPHSYYFYCNDTNGTDMFDFSTAAITYGLKYSNNIAGCTLGTHCKSGFCVHNICRAAATYCGDGYCDAGEGACTVDCGSGGSTGGSLPISSVITPIVSTLPPSITFPNTVFNNANGLLIIPEDGAVMSLSIDGKYIIDPSGYPISFVLFGSAGTANVIKTVEITPDQFKETKCYQETLASYVLEIEGENKYLCLNIEDYSKENVIDIKTYKFVDDDWQEISYQDYNGKLCSPITSTPYMIAGFKSSSTQQEALTKILMAESTLEVASESGQDTEYAEQLITEANVAYWSCQYASASDLAIRAVQSVKTIELPLYMILSGVAIILAGILYLFRNKLNFIKFPKKEITSINETTVSEISKKKLKKQK